MATCILGFSCSPAGVWGLELNDVDFSVSVGHRHNAALWCLWFLIAAQVVQRQELGINLAGVRKHWIWKWGYVRVTDGGDLWGYSDPQREKCSFLLHHYWEVRTRGQLQNSTPCFWEEFNLRFTKTLNVCFDPTEEQLACNPAANIPIVSAALAGPVLLLVWPVS